MLYVLCPNLRIRGHLPAPIINGGGDSLWKWSNFRLSRARDLDLGSGHASLINLYLHTKFHWNRRKFLWMDGHTDGHLRPTLLSRLGGVDLKMDGFPTPNGLWPCRSIGSYCIRSWSCITHRSLPTCQISLKSKKLFVDGQMYRRTDRFMDGHLRPPLLHWLFDSVEESI